MRDGQVIGPEGSVTLQEVARIWYLRPQDLPAHVNPGGLEATAGYKPARDSGTFSYGAHAALVAVDPEIGSVEILDYVIVEDGGKLVNPMVVDGQIYGGAAQGIGTALYEEMPFDASGQPLASTFADYLLPGPTEVPNLRILHMETVSPYTEFGVKGIGEGGAIAPPAAIANAVNDALRPLGASRTSAVPAHAAARPQGDRGSGAPSTQCAKRQSGKAVVKPPRFEYERPADLAAVIALTRREDIAVKILAGGQSLGPMLNLRLVQPDVLVDITGIPELKRVEENADAIIVGACVTHADIEDGRVPDVTGGALPGVARGIAYRAVRNRGTIGGSLSHADPSADWVSSLAAIGAEVLIRGPAGQRSLAIEDFVTGAFEVALDPGEILEAVRIPRLSRSARWGFYKICRKTGELAQAIAAVLHDPERSVFRAVIGATESRPIVFTDAASLFSGKPRAGLPAAFDAGAAARVLSAAGMTDPFDNQIHVVALKRAIDRAHLA